MGICIRQGQSLGSLSTAQARWINRSVVRSRLDWSYLLNINHRYREVMSGRYKSIPVNPVGDYRQLYQ